MGRDRAASPYLSPGSPHLCLCRGMGSPAPGSPILLSNRRVCMVALAFRLRRHRSQPAPRPLDALSGCDERAPGNWLYHLQLWSPVCFYSYHAWMPPGLLPAICPVHLPPWWVVLLLAPLLQVLLQDPLKWFLSRYSALQSSEPTITYPLHSNWFG